MWPPKDINIIIIIITIIFSIVVVAIIIIIRCCASRRQLSWTSTYPHLEHIPGHPRTHPNASATAVFLIISQAVSLSSKCFFCLPLLLFPSTLPVVTRCYTAFRLITWPEKVGCPFLISFTNERFVCDHFDPLRYLSVHIIRVLSALHKNHISFAFSLQ